MKQANAKAKKDFKYSDDHWFLSSIPSWRVRTFIHDCLLHPVAGMLWILGFSDAGDWIHEKTAPMLCRKCKVRFDAENCPNCGGLLE